MKKTSKIQDYCGDIIPAFALVHCTFFFPLKCTVAQRMHMEGSLPVYMFTSGQIKKRKFICKPYKRMQKDSRDFLLTERIQERTCTQKIFVVSLLLYQHVAAIRQFPQQGAYSRSARSSSWNAAFEFLGGRNGYRDRVL